MDRAAGRFCSPRAKDGFFKEMRQQVLHANGLMLVNSVLVAVLVGVVAYIPRGRRHPLFRFLFIGASTLFLPIVTDIASTVTSPYTNVSYINGPLVLAAYCEPGTHIILVLVWTGLVLVIATNTNAVVAGDEREGRTINPSMDLLFKALWLAYLTFSTISLSRFRYTTDKVAKELNKINIAREVTAICSLLYAIAAYKLFQRYLAFYMAQRSVALGCNPRLIVSYMANLGESEIVEENDLSACPPALLVKGEETIQVEELPSGYFKVDVKNREFLVTFDRVWRSDGMLLKLEEYGIFGKDLCFSFALFKLLRCRFAKYGILDAGFTRGCKFFRCKYLQCDNYERVFRVIEDELSFIHDYYYSSLPVSYSMSLLPFLNILVSLLSIGYCTYMFTFIRQAWHQSAKPYYQITCSFWCPLQTSLPGTESGVERTGFGSKYFDTLPVCFVLAVVILSEIRDIMAYICSNWTKVHLICKYISKDSWPQKCIGFVFKYCRCKLMTNWEDKMNQCSVLVLHPRHLLRLPRPLLRLPEATKKVKLPRAVKAAIFEVLKGLTSEQAPLDVGEGGRGGAIMHIRPPSFPVSAGSTAGMICDFKGTADTILAWHIATSIFEVTNSQTSSSDPKDAATHLSRYCAYLVACRPELVPDDDKWCKSLYKAVKKDADRALSNHDVESTPEARYQQLVQLLSADSNHEVLKNGAKLGKHLVGNGATWEMLARFWSEMILSVAPKSENLDGHTEAIARGGELITLLWALLAHAGITVDRQLDVAKATGAAAGHQV